MPRRPSPLWFIAAGILLTAIALVIGGKLSSGSASTSTSSDAAPTTVIQVPTLAPTPTLAPPTATPVPPPPPTATVVPIRTDCNAIRGGDYQSPEERTYFLANCVGP